MGHAILSITSFETARFLRPAANFTVANKPSALSRMTRWLRKPN